MNAINQYDLTSEEIEDVSGGVFLLAFATGVAFAYWAA